MEQKSRDFAPKIEGPSYRRDDERGLFVEVTNGGPWETVITGSMKAGSSLGDHYHRECRALFFLIRGKAEVKTRFLMDDAIQTLPLNAMEKIMFRPFEVHTIHFVEESDFILLKSYRYEDDNPDIFVEDAPE